MDGMENDHLSHMHTNCTILSFRDSALFIFTFK
jgi:hypothetical protein